MDETVEILIVDDDRVRRELIGRLLLRRGYEVQQAADGQTCLAMVFRRPPDLVLLDVVLPDIAGAEVCRRIKDAPELADVHVHFLSSVRVAADDQADGLEMGGDGYITWPIGNRELLARVTAALRLQQSDKRLRRQRQTLDAQLRQMACVHTILQIMMGDGHSADVMFQQIVEKMPYACSEPDQVSVRIGFNGSIFTSAGFRKCEHTMTDDIRVDGRRVGMVEIGCPLAYADQMDRDDAAMPEGFLVTIARGLGFMVKRFRTQTALRQILAVSSRSQRMTLALAKASESVQRARTEREVYARVGAELKKLGISTTILRLDSDARHLHVVHSTLDDGFMRQVEGITGISVEDYSFEYPRGGFIDRFLRANQVVFEEDVSHGVGEVAPALPQHLELQLSNLLKAHRYIMAPLMTGKGVVGILAVSGEDLSRADVIAVEAFARQTAAAVETAVLYAAEHRQRQVAESLREIGRVLSSTLDVETLWAHLLDHLGALMTYDSASLMLVEQGVARILYASGYDRFLSPADLEELMQAPLVLADVPLLAEMSFQQQPRIVEDTRSDSQWVARPSSAHIRSWVGAPIVLDGDVVACLCLDRVVPRAYGPDDAQTLAAFAAQAGLAFQNARLFAQVEAGRQRLRLLTRQLVRTQEEERQKLSRELHDEAGQALTALKIQLDMIRTDLPPELTDLRQRVRAAGMMADETMEQLRLMAQGLRPPALDTVGLSAALEGVCQDFAERIPLIVDYCGCIHPDLAEDVSVTLFRCLQEALTNVARHANATHVAVELAYRREILWLTITDDGQGFDALQILGCAVDQRHSGELGLQGMRERLALVNGRLNVQSAPGGGCLLCAQIPLAESR